MTAGLLSTESHIIKELKILLIVLKLQPLMSKDLSQVLNLQTTNIKTDPSSNDFY